MTGASGESEMEHAQRLLWGEMPLHERFGDLTGLLMYNKIWQTYQARTPACNVTHDASRAPTSASWQLLVRSLLLAVERRSHRSIDR